MKKFTVLFFVVFACVCLFAQDKKGAAVGQVVDSKTTQPITGVSVKIKGTNKGAITDAHGKFTLAADSGTYTLVYSCIGYSNYELKKVAVKPGQTYNCPLVSLNPKTEELEEVVIQDNLNMQKGEGKGYNGNYGKTDKNLEYFYAPMGTMKQLSISSQNYHITQNNRYNTADSVQLTTDWNTEEYGHIIENEFLESTKNPLSTFSIDVDRASYSNIRRFINQNTMPENGAVRLEEMINYFSYNYPQPKNNDPFSINTEISACPWNKEHQLISIGLQGKEIKMENTAPLNLTFLLDVSGSMSDYNKLPLVKESLKLLIDKMRPQDMISIVVYAGNAGKVLDPTSGAHKDLILEALNRLEAGGSTAGGAGIQLAYKLAKENYTAEKINRVILCTDGDFNVGLSSDDALVKLIEKERESGIFLTVLGYGMGNYKDSKMEQLANKGNGNYAYIDDIMEAKKTLVKEMGGTLNTIAKDVKIQVEFNPNKVKAYRLVGYEDRMLKAEDFNDDKKDAGELGSGHTVTALYEIIPAGSKETLSNIDPLKYQQTNMTNYALNSDEIMTVKFRYKAPNENVSKLIEQPVTEKDLNKVPTNNFKWAATVAEFGMLLRDSKFKGSANFDELLAMAKSAKGDDEEGYRAEMIKLIEKAELLKK